LADRKSVALAKSGQASTPFTGPFAESGKNARGDLS